tara:strand:- start:37 stop:807 length:771 start_codon:yes stop_codon:yes gene_type:complete
MNIVTEAPIPGLSTSNILKGNVSNSNVSNSNDTWYYIKIFGMILIIVLLGINVYLYATEGTTLITKFMESGILNTTNNTEVGLEKVDKELEELAKTKLEKTLEKANEPNLNKMKYKHTVELQKIMEKKQDDLKQYERDVEYEGKEQDEEESDLLKPTSKKVIKETEKERRGERKRLRKSINEKQKQQDEERSKAHYVPSPDLSSDSDIQVASKKGYCYIGSYKGKRSCISVEKGTECMSGDIFPSMDVCINENLRR